jgi:hypothetical protein
LGEIVIQRDDKNRIVGVSVGELGLATSAEASAAHFMQAAAASLAEYLHVPVAFSGDTGLMIDRSDVLLDREINAVLETLVIGLRMLEKQHPADLVVHEATVGVEV